jgi:hypothetical protein
MLRRGPRRRWAAGTAFPVILAASAVVVPARGADEPPPDAKQACIAATERGQGQRDEGKYRAAREAFAACTQDTCPRVVQQSCTKWLRELDESAPTVVLGAKDEHGTDLTDVTVTLDGAPFATLLDGKPVLIDTGPHTLRFEKQGGAWAEQKLVVRAGERARVVSVTLGSSNPDSTPEPTPEEAEKPPLPEAVLSARHVTAAAMMLGALAAGGTGLAFVLMSNSNANTAAGYRAKLDSSTVCGGGTPPPDCGPLSNAANAQHTDMNIATGLFVGAGVLLASSVTAWFVWPKPHASEAKPDEPKSDEPKSDEPKPDEQKPEEPKTTGAIVPLWGGAAVFLSRTF